MNWCHLKALLHRGADHTITSGRNNIFFMVIMYSRSAHQQSIYSLQASTAKYAVTSLLAHSCLVPLCSLAISQRVGVAGLPEG